MNNSEDFTGTGVGSVDWWNGPDENVKLAVEVLRKSFAERDDLWLMEE